MKELDDIIGINDRKTCEQKLVDAYVEDDEGLNYVRQTMYDIAKCDCADFPEGVLVKRVKRSGQSKTVPEKYASDVYLLYKFYKGAIQSHVIQSDVLSKVKLSHAKVHDVADFDKDIASKMFSKMMCIHEDML